MPKDDYTLDGCMSQHEFIHFSFPINRKTGCVIQQVIHVQGSIFHSKLSKTISETSNLNCIFKTPFKSSKFHDGVYLKILARYSSEIIHIAKGKPLMKIDMKI